MEVVWNVLWNVAANVFKFDNKDGGHSLIDYLPLPPCEYAIVHFDTYPSHRPIHAYTK